MQFLFWRMRCLLKIGSIVLNMMDITYIWRKINNPSHNVSPKLLYNSSIDWKDILLISFSLKKQVFNAFHITCAQLLFAEWITEYCFTGLSPLSFSAPPSIFVYSFKWVNLWNIKTPMVGLASWSSGKSVLCFYCWGHGFDPQSGS